MKKHIQEQDSESRNTEDLEPEQAWHDMPGKTEKTYPTGSVQNVEE